MIIFTPNTVIKSADVNLNLSGIADGSLAPALPKAVNRKDIAVDNIVSNQLIQTGWGYHNLASGVRYVGIQVTYPVAFDDIPIVMTNYAGFKTVAHGVPTSVGNGIDGYSDVIRTTAFTTTISSTYIAISYMDATNLPVGYHIYSWIAIGTKAR